MSIVNNLTWEYLLYGSLAFILAWALTWLVRKIAWHWQIIDRPTEQRKIHKEPTALLGGLAIFLTVTLILLMGREHLVVGDLEYHHWAGVLAGAILLIIGGALDDKFNLSPRQQIIWPVLAALCVIAGGVGIEKVSNPLGNLFFLDQLKWPLFSWQGHTYYFVLIADLFTFLWLLGMMFTTKLLDGLDGLVSGMTAIGSLIIFLFTITTKYYQPDIALASLVLAGACLGYLVWAWHPAKIFLGEGGAMFLGFALGVLSIISGGKIAIALLIMGIPILDVAWTIIRRLKAGHNPFRHADRQHLHFRLLDSGLGTKKTVLVYYLLAAIFGLSALFLQSVGKLVSLSVLGLIMLALIIFFSWLDKKGQSV